jgi:hypothetical protein
MDETQVNPVIADDTVQDPATTAPEVTEGEVVIEAPVETEEKKTA